jgi:hypothetical protein
LLTRLFSPWALKGHSCLRKRLDRQFDGFAHFSKMRYPRAQNEALETKILGHHDSKYLWTWDGDLINMHKQEFHLNKTFEGKEEVSRELNLEGWARSLWISEIARDAVALGHKCNPTKTAPSFWNICFALGSAVISSFGSLHQRPSRTAVSRADSVPDARRHRDSLSIPIQIHTRIAHWVAPWNHNRLRVMPKKGAAQAQLYGCSGSFDRLIVPTRRPMWQIEPKAN